MGATYKPVLDGDGGINFVSGTRTVDFHGIAERFRDFGLKIDQASLKDLSRIRNDMEHLYTEAARETVREAIAKAFPVVVDLFREIEEDPLECLGDSWTIMLDVKACMSVN